MHVHVPCCKSANQLVYAYQHPERGRGEGGGKGGEKISAARAGGDVPNFPGGASPRTAGGCAAGGPVLSTAIFLFLCILKALMSAENAPVFGMLVRLQVNQHGPVGGLGVALGLFWARRTNLRGHISLYRPLEHPSRPGCGPPIFLILGSCARTFFRGVSF